METMKGYKVFNPDWTCRDKQYTCPGKFEEDIDIDICRAGMHFCERLIDCFTYYFFDPTNKVAEVIAYGKIKAGSHKLCTDKLEIVRELSWEEVLYLVNIGNGNTGRSNIGNFNSGSENVGSFNTGSENVGDYNEGHFNIGWCNYGDNNIGGVNSGDNNIGFFNMGKSNIGFFNTIEQKPMFFNKPSSITFNDFYNSNAWCIIEPLFDRVTIDEGINYGKWWDDLTDKEKGIIKSIPNFDPDIFKEITGIDVKEETQKCNDI